MRLNFQVIKGGLVSSFCFLLLSCQSYSDNSATIKQFVNEGRFAEAEKQLLEKIEKTENDKLIYMLDLASVYQIQNEFKKSNDLLIKADRFSDIQDYTSLSRETGAVLLAEELKQYKGEDFEIVLINTMAAINFLALNDLDGALVEVRRMNEKIRRFRDEADRKYFNNNSFAHYLSGLIWESSGKWDDAFISYNNAYQIDPHSSLIQHAVLASAQKARRLGEFNSLKAQIPSSINLKIPRADEGELVVLFLQGWGPSKQYHPENFRYPIMRPNYTYVDRASIEIPGYSVFSTEEVFSVTNIAVTSLQDQYNSMMAKKIGGVFAKAVVADQFRQKNEVLGDLAWVVMNVTDRADLRHWSQLPNSLQVARMPLPAGGYTVKIRGLDASGRETPHDTGDQRILIRPGEKKFLIWRSFR